MRLIASSIVMLALAACQGDRQERATPCERIAENARRLAPAPVQSDTDREPYPVERCQRDRLDRAALDCLTYASSWDEFERCAPDQVHAAGTR